MLAQTLNSLNCPVLRSISDLSKFWFLMYRLITSSFVASPTVPMYLPSLQNSPPHNSSFLSLGKRLNTCFAVIDFINCNTSTRAISWLSTTKNMNVIPIKTKLINYNVVSFINTFHCLSYTFLNFWLQQYLTILNCCHKMIPDFIDSMWCLTQFHTVHIIIPQTPFKKGDSRMSPQQRLWGIENLNKNSKQSFLFYVSRLLLFVSRLLKYLTGNHKLKTENWKPKTKNCSLNLLETGNRKLITVLLLLLVVFLFMSLPAYAGINHSTNIWARGRRMTSALAIDPANTSIIYVGTESGSIYKSTDGGANWNPVNTGLQNIHALAIDPSNTSIIYAGTWGNGVYKSSNGGANWSQLI